jgi:hypothetical protein
MIHEVTLGSDGIAGHLAEGARQLLTVALPKLLGRRELRFDITLCPLLGQDE